MAVSPRRSRSPAPTGGEATLNDDARDVRERALGLLARREHSRLELERKLGRHGHEASETKPVLDALQAEGLLSDERYAAAYVESRAGRGFGPVRIMEELRQRGVAADASRDACNPGSPDWAARALQARRKRFGDAAPVEFRERARQARFLAGRGFDRSQVNAALAADPDSADRAPAAGGAFSDFPED